MILTLRWADAIPTCRLFCLAVFIVCSRSCQFPIDVDEDNMEPDDLRKAMVRDPDTPVDNAITLTFFLHFLKLKRIASDIQHTIYRLDKGVESSSVLVDGFVEQLKVWRQRLPPSHPDTLPRNLVTQCVSLLRWLLSTHGLI